MEAGSLIVILVITALGAGWLALPFIRRQRGVVENAPDIERNTLLNDYARVVALLRDLEEDHNTGKMNDEAYALEKARLSERGIALLEALDKEGLLPASRRVDAAHSSEAPPHSAADEALDEALEAAIARYASAKVKG
jgi:hypothetical protein